MKSLCVLVLAALSSIFAADGAAADHDPAPVVQVWATTSDRSYALTALPVATTGEASTSDVRIALDPGRRYQDILGFGAAVTDTSAWLIQRRMRAGQRKALLRELFGRDGGIGLGFTRMTIGASDFSLSHYSLDDPPRGKADLRLRHFRVAQQTQDVFTVVRAARAINPQLQTMASPWSAPAWMKSGGSMIQGTLSEDAYDAFARYLLKYVDVAASKGVPIFALTLQNEPAFEPANYPGMRLSADQRIALIGKHLGPLLKASGRDVRILDWDHNWDMPEEPTAVLSNPEASAYVDGVAWHCYGGDITAQSQVYDRFPSKSVYLTECSGGDWEPVRSGGMTMLARQLIIGGTRHWARGVLLWNLALDETSGPHAGGCENCRGVVTIDSRTGAVTRNDEYYVLAHASRFVRPGAHRIESSAGADDVDNVAFTNADDGSIALIVTNSSANPRTIAVTSAGRTFRYALAPKSLYTFTWPG
jgi:glucosylceramidase